MQEETPLAPAQIITSVTLLPQYFLQSVLDTMGRVACCSLSGVLRAERTRAWGQGPGRGHQRPPEPCPPAAWASSITMVVGAGRHLPRVWEAAPLSSTPGSASALPAQLVKQALPPSPCARPTGPCVWVEAPSLLPSPPLPGALGGPRGSTSLFCPFLATCVLNRPAVSDSVIPGTEAPQAPPSVEFSGNNTGVGCHFLLHS